MEKYKQKLLDKVKLHIDFVRQKIQGKLQVAKELANQSLKGFGKLSSEDQAVFPRLSATRSEKDVFKWFPHSAMRRLPSGFRDKGRPVLRSGD